jgi:transcriptional regulator with XRE-family HTH domain
MTKIAKKTARSKDPAAVRIGKRIAQARKMAGFRTAKDFREKLSDWPDNRLSWYEAGYSMPHPADVERIATLTDASPCWIMFGLGPIRSAQRDLQAVRHQNLIYLHGQQLTQVASAQLDPAQLSKHLDNPFLHIGERLARRLEQAAARPERWLDEQHVESDGLCASFPDELRELMTLYSEMDSHRRTLLLALANTVSEQR